MKTIFDLRKNSSDELINKITAFYEEPLNVVQLKNEPIKSCIGCWSCWLKTPGKCVMQDQMSASYKDYINSDTVICLLDCNQGFIDHQAKAFFDRSIPHYMPYVEMIDDECHHVARYASYPAMVFYFDTSDLTSQEENVIEDYLSRTAFHFKSTASRLIIQDGVMLKGIDKRVANTLQRKFDFAEPMDKLIIYNGSPRLIVSNSGLILKQVSDSLGEKVEIRDLKDSKRWHEWANNFEFEANVMFFMPLYVHAMPSHVMNFLELLQPSKGSLSYFVQSGFPESGQSHYLEAYFEQLTIRLGRHYAGTAIKGGVEGLQLMSAKQSYRIISLIVETIKKLIDTGHYDLDHIEKLASPVKFDKPVVIIFKLLSHFKLVNSYWDKPLKQNKAFEHRFDRPYAKGKIS